MLNSVCVITVKVKNMEEAIDFYTNVLGFKVSKQYGEKIVSLVHDHIPIVLEETEHVESGSQQNVLFGLQSDDLDKDMEYLHSKEVTFLFDEPKPCPPGRYTVIVDTSGNQIELLEFSN
jgi:lactoylglutathione lyase